MCLWWPRMLNTMSPGCTGLKTIFGGMRGPRGEHWGSCKGRGLAQKDYHGWMKLDSEMVLNHCACCSDPPQCYMCLQTWLALTSFFVDSFHWQHHVMCSFFCALQLRPRAMGFLAASQTRFQGMELIIVFCAGVWFLWSVLDATLVVSA